jgi:hypothetical protein
MLFRTLVTIPDEAHMTVARRFEILLQPAS